MAAPPTQPWTFPADITAEILRWLSLATYVGLALSIAATIIFGMLLAADKNRGEPVSARTPHMQGLQIALGVVFITCAGSIAGFFA